MIAAKIGHVFNNLIFSRQINPILHLFNLLIQITKRNEASQTFPHKSAILIAANNFRFSYEPNLIREIKSDCMKLFNHDIPENLLGFLLGFEDNRY